MKNYEYKYEEMMKLLRLLFKKLYVGSEFDEFEEHYNYFIREYDSDCYYLISEDLHEILLVLDIISKIND